MKMWGVKFMKNGLIKKEDYTISELSTTNISALLSLLHGKMTAYANYSTKR